MLGLLNIGPLEVLLLVGAAVLLFGGDLPDQARKAGRLVARLRATASDLGRALREEGGELRDELPPRLPGSRTEPPAELAPPEPDGAPGPAGGSGAPGRSSAADAGRPAPDTDGDAPRPPA